MTGHAVRAGYVQAPWRVELREVELPDPGPDEVAVNISACGVCGTDLRWAASRAIEPRPFGHEIAGVVTACGTGVEGLTVGQDVCLESSWFCGRCEACRNGHTNLCRSVTGLGATSPALGFAERMVVRARAAIPACGLSPAVACLAEPLGVAQDLVHTSGLEWDDDVLVVGPGPIGLMAVVLVRSMGARRVVVGTRQAGTDRARLALAWGADEVIDLIDLPLRELAHRFGGFTRILVTAPPSLIANAIHAAAPGGTITYIGIDYRPGATIVLDADLFHFNKLQLRASHASPALWLPRSIDLLARGVVRWEEMISHEFSLSELSRAIEVAATQRSAAVKVVVHPDGS